MNSPIYRMKSSALAVAVASMLCLIGATSPAQATPLNLITGPPDIYSNLITANYTASTGAFTANGTSDMLNGVNLSPTGIFALSATISNSGIASSVSLAITGNGSSNLLSGSQLIGFGFSNNILEFLVGNLSGDLASQYTSGNAGVVLNQIGFPGSFASDFSTEHPVGASDTGNPVPEPSTIILVLTGVGMALIVRKRQV
jgi:hypothetical protein